MSIRSIQENQQKQSIYITYSIAQGDCLLEMELMSKQVNFSLFSENYLNLYTPFEYFKLNQQQNGFISLNVFLEILRQIEKNPIKGASNDIINKLLDEFECIDEDLNQRLVLLYKFSDNPQFSDKNSKNLSDQKLLRRIKEIDQQITNTYKTRKPEWQLLYVVETTATQIWNGEEKKIIKLGKTTQTIENYVNQLKRDYQGKIDFKPLFVQRLYTPGNTQVDKKYFHKKLLASIPDSKLYLKANKSEKSQIHYEFYFLTKEFVQNFEILLHQFILQYKSEYIIQDQAIDDDKNDENSEETQNILEKQFQEQNYNNNHKQKEVQNQILLNQNAQSESDQILNLIQNDQILDENTNNTELTHSLDDDYSFQKFFDFDDKTNQTILGIPINYELSDESEQIVSEASEMINNKDNLLRAFLYLAAAKRQKDNNDQ